MEFPLFGIISYLANPEPVFKGYSYGDPERKQDAPFSQQLQTGLRLASVRERRFSFLGPEVLTEEI